MAKDLNELLKYLLEHKDENDASRGRMLSNIHTGMSDQYFAIIANILIADRMISATESTALRMLPEYSIIYQISKRGIKHIKKGGYDYNPKREATYEQKLERRREVNDNFTYYRNLLWLGGIILGVILIFAIGKFSLESILELFK